MTRELLAEPACYEIQKVQNRKMDLEPSEIKSKKAQKRSNKNDEKEKCKQTKQAQKLADLRSKQQ